MTIHLGTQGWSYKSWENVFYPPCTAPGDYLAQYGQRGVFVARRTPDMWSGKLHCAIAHAFELQ